MGLVVDPCKFYIAILAAKGHYENSLAIVH